MKVKNTRINTFANLVNLIGKGKIVAVRKRLKNTDCQLSDNYGTTLLHVASDKCKHILIQHMLKNKLIDIDAQDHHGKTALMLALRVRRPISEPLKDARAKVIQIFLDYKANIFICNNNGKCALQMIFEQKLLRYKFIKQLVNIAKKENQSDGENLARKLIDSNCILPHVMLLKNTQITKILLKNGYQIDTKDLKTGDTALHVAVKLRDIKNVKLLIAAGANVYIMNKKNQIPFFHDSYNNSVKELEILKILVESGTLLTTCDINGNFLITKVLKQGNYEALTVLLNSNINLMARDASRLTPIHHLLGNIEAFDKNPEMTIESLRKKAFDVNDTDDFGYSLFKSALLRGIHPLVKFLLERGVQCNHFDVQQFWPLYMTTCIRCTEPAEISSYKKCIELLLEYEADPQYIMPNSLETVFDIIFYYGHCHAVEPICGQLAILEDRGTQISDLIRSKIDAQKIIKDQFESCKRQLEELKTTVVHCTMTLYKLLSESRKNIVLYARDDDFLSALMKFDNNYSSNSYYCHLLQSHLEKPIKYATMRREIINILFEVVGLIYHSNHIIVDKIIGYALNELL